MKGIKKIILSFLVSLIIVIIIQFVWAEFGDNSVSVYVAINDIYKGEKILKENVKEIKVQKNSEISKYYNIKIENKFAKENIVSGKLLENNDLASKNVEVFEDESYEYITIELKEVSDALAYQLKKGDYINVYYTTNNKKLNSVLTDKNKTIETDLNITFRIFENIKVIGLYDSDGAETNIGKQYKAIMLRVKKEEAILVSNIKKEGTFTVSTVK